MSHKLIGAWKNITSGSVNRKIFGAALTIAIFTALVKVAGVIKELIVAWKFGISDDIDAFLIALLIPAFISNIVGSSFGAAFVPTYLHVLEKEGVKNVKKLFTGVTIWGLALLSIVATLVVYTAPTYLPWIAAGFSKEKLELTFNLLCIIALSIPLTGIIYMWGSTLNAGEHFALAALLPALTPTITIFFLFGFQEWGVFALATGLVCGAILEIIALGVALHQQGISLSPKFNYLDTHLYQVVKQFIPMSVAAVLICSAGIIDQSMAAMLSPGSVAALNYGNRLILPIISLIGTALNTAVIPYFSKMFVSEDWRGLSLTLNKYLKIIFLFFLPLTGLVILFSEIIIKITFQRGIFTSESTSLVSQIQSFYVLQTPFYIANILLVRLITSMELNHLIMCVSGLNLVINVGLNYLFIQWIGIQGIALSTSCMFIFSCFYLLYVVNKKLNEYLSKPI